MALIGFNCDALRKLMESFNYRVRLDWLEPLKCIGRIRRLMLNVDEHVRRAYVQLLFSLFFLSHTSFESDGKRKTIEFFRLWESIKKERKKDRDISARL